jgi:hypothetical protein
MPFPVVGRTDGQPAPLAACMKKVVLLVNAWPAKYLN